MRRALLAVVACSAAPHPIEPHEPRVLANERAFARLYGTLRWFHPSDECAALDWDAFAVYGVAKVRDAADADALAAALRELALPIAPTVRIGAHPEATPVPTGELTWWEHLGAGVDSGVGEVYASKRHGIAAHAVSQDSGFGGFAQAVDATPYRGAKIRLRGRVRDSVQASAMLWLRVDRGTQQGFFDNMEDRPIRSGQWTPAEIVGTVDADATAITFGAMLTAGTEAWFDDLALEVDRGGTWTPIAIANGTFDTNLDGWRAIGSRWPIAVDRGEAHVSAPVGADVTDEVFDDQPRPDEVTDVDLGDGLHARVPLVVARAGGHTLPAGRPLALPAFDAKSPDAWLADVIVAWNTYADFSPYFDVIGEDWDRVLDDTLRDALDDTTEADHLVTLHRLVHRLHDGHGYVFANEPSDYPPIAFGWVENKVVVLRSSDDRIHAGDVVTAVDGEPADKRMARLMALASGSEQWTRYHALQDLARGERKPAHLTIAGTDIEVARDAAPPKPFEHPPITELEPGIWYVDLDGAPMADIDAHMDDLAKAKGVVIDLRGYPKGNHDILRHIITKPDDKKWMHVPHILRPRMRDIAGWTDEGWDLEAAEPHLRNVVFVTNDNAVSYAESVMGYVAYEGLPIVGSATAGANGNIVYVSLPTGARVTFTGMKVTRHDGGQQHLIGIRPTVPAEPTIAGVAAGRDEVLERAIAVVKSTH